MLGVRLTAETDRRLSEYARRTRRSKSDVTRDAVSEYLARHDSSDEWHRQLLALAEESDPDALALLDQAYATLTADEPPATDGDRRA